MDPNPIEKIDPSLISSSKRRDTLQLADTKEIKKLMKNGEKLIWSGEITKINKIKRRQVRRFVLTNKRFFNLGDDKFLDSFISFFTGTKVKRSIEIKDIKFITYSARSNEFVIHVPEHYDYRLSSAESRDEFIMYCLAIRKDLEKEGVPPIKFYFREEIELVNYSRNEGETEIKLPGNPIEMNKDQFDEWKNKKDKKKDEDIKGSETIFNNDTKNINGPINEDCFDVIRTLGRGTFGKVILCEKKDTNELYAVKIFSKADIIEGNQIEAMKTEKKILEEMNHEFLVGLEFCFTNPSRIFFGMKFLQGGELFQHLRIKKRFPEAATKFYAAQVLLALEYLHKKNIIYRDLKPENIMFDKNGYLKLVDFGVCKRLTSSDARTQTVVGTPEYLPPEIIIQKGHNKCADWWSFGILIYEMLTGSPPFYSKNQNEMFRKIIQEDFKFPHEYDISEDCKDMVRKLLTKNPENRLGSQKDAEMIKEHPWFNDMDFEKLRAFQIKPPFVPKILNEKDTENFDKTFTQEDPRNTVRGSQEILMIENFEQEFKTFEYNKN